MGFEKSGISADTEDHRTVKEMLNELGIENEIREDIVLLLEVRDDERKAQIQRLMVEKEILKKQLNSRDDVRKAQFQVREAKFQLRVAQFQLHKAQFQRRLNNKEKQKEEDDANKADEYSQNKEI
ncbi:MAG: hypothetical protein MHMPM18_002188 [Marteilia pararefringens]